MPAKLFWYCIGWWADNQLITVPQTIGALPKLTHLRLQNNKLQYLPASIQGIESLYSFSVSKNPMVDDIYESLGPLEAVFGSEKVGSPILAALTLI